MGMVVNIGLYTHLNHIFVFGGCLACNFIFKFIQTKP